MINQDKRDLAVDLISLRPPWVIVKELIYGTVYYQGKPFPYTLIKEEAWSEKLPNFAGLFSGKNNSKHLAVSENVPAIFRKYLLLSELIKFYEFTDEPGSYLKALRRELAIVPSAWRKRYSEYRISTFVELSNYYSQFNDQENLQAFQTCIDFLKFMIEKEDKKMNESAMDLLVRLARELPRTHLPLRRTLIPKKYGIKVIPCGNCGRGTPIECCRYCFYSKKIDIS